MESQQGNPDLRAVFSKVLDAAALIPLLISGGTSKVTIKSSTSTSLTDLRIEWAQRVLSNIFAYKSHNSEVFLSSSSSSENKLVPMCVVGPVINPTTGKKDTSTSFQEYSCSRQSHVKTRDRPHSDEMSEAWIVEAVVCYDFLHNELTKPVQAMGLSGVDVDPSFREAIKVLYNRSRVSCILQKFEEGVNSKLYPPLPSLESVNLKLLRNEHEQKIINKYIVGFLPMLDKFVPTRIAKICAELWRYLLFLSQDYSQYYSQIRTLCEKRSRSYAVMHARIWMLKVILAIYDGAFAFLNLKPLDYV